MKFFWFFIFELFLSSFALSSFAQQHERSEESFYREIRVLIDASRLDETRRLIDTAIQQYPESSTILFEKARYILKTTAVKSNTPILGYALTKEGLAQSIAVLQKAIKHNPSDPAPYSLMVNIYSVSQQPDKALHYIKLHEGAKGTHNWFTFNKSLYHISMKEYDEAYRILKQNVQGAMHGKVYMASWSILSSLRKFDNKFEYEEIVSKGIMERIESENLIEYLKIHQDKTVLLYVSSSDRTCGYCVKSNHRVKSAPRELENNNVKVIYVSFEPWTKIGNSAVTKSLNITNVPAVLMLNKGKTVLEESGGFVKKNDAERIMQQGLDFVASNRFNRFDSAPLDYKRTLLKDLFQQTLKSYAKSPYLKAQAIALDENGRWVQSKSVSNLTQNVANEKSLKQCEKSRRKYSIKNRCQLLFVGDDIVLKDLEPRTKEILEADFQFYTAQSGKEYVIADWNAGIKKLLISNKNIKYKAFAFAVDNNGRKSVAYIANKQSQLAADKKALSDCESVRKSASIKSVCQLFKVDI